MAVVMLFGKQDANALKGTHWSRRCVLVCPCVDLIRDQDPKPREETSEGAEDHQAVAARIEGNPADRDEGNQGAIAVALQEAMLEHRFGRSMVFPKGLDDELANDGGVLCATIVRHEVNSTRGEVGKEPAQDATTNDKHPEEECAGSVAREQMKPARKLKTSTCDEGRPFNQLEMQRPLHARTLARLTPERQSFSKVQRR